MRLYPEGLSQDLFTAGTAGTAEGELKLCWIFWVFPQIGTRVFKKVNLQ